MSSGKQLPTLAKRQLDELVFRAEVFELLDGAREAAGISQYELCKHADVNQSTYSRLRKKPHAWRRDTITTLLRSLKALRGVSDKERSALRKRILSFGPGAPKSKPSTNEERSAA